jgi:hypothetical protein
MRARVSASLLFLSTFLVGSAYAQNTYYLPHIANGNYGSGSYKMTFVLFNNSSTPVTADLDLTDDNGNPLRMTITNYGTDSSFSVDLPAGSSKMLQTDGQGNVVQGAATVTTNASIGVSAIFSIYDSHNNYVTETGVGGSQPQQTFILPVDTTGFFNTGLALYNPGSSDAAITLTLRNTGGSPVGSPVPVTLKGGRHTAQFINGQLFPTLGAFQGTLLVQSSAPIAAMVLRMYQSGPTLTFTSLPVVPTSSTKTALNLAHVANGGGYQTSYLIFNVSSSAANITLTQTKDNGTALSTGVGTGGVYTATIPVNGSVFLKTDGGTASTTDQGGAKITSNVPIGACGVFTVSSAGVFQTETGVSDSTLLTSFTLPVDITGNFDTGIAFYNPGTSSATLTIRLLDADGNKVGSDTTRTLSAQGHLATFADNLFPNTSNFRGSLTVSSTSSIAAMTLRMNTVPLSFTTLPVVSGAYGGGSGGTTGTALLSKQETGIAVTSNATKDEILPGGFKLTGTISGPGTAGAVMAISGQSAYSGAVKAGKYLVVLPAGTYSLSAVFTPDGVPSTASLTISSSTLDTVTVSGDTTKNLTLPSVTVFPITGTVNGLSNLTGASSLSIDFTSTDVKVDGSFDVSTSGSYSGVLPAGSYTASLDSSIKFLTAPLQSQSLTLNLGSATISGNTTVPAFTVPATAKLSGTLRGTTMPVMASVSATGPNSLIISSSTADMLASQYQAILPKNTTYALGVTLMLTQGTTSMGFLSFPVPGTSLTLNSDATNDFTVPSLPTRYTLSGKITDGSGNPVSGAMVMASSSSITGTPTVQFINTAQSDSGGNYSVSVLSGTNYTVYFVPPLMTP